MDPRKRISEEPVLSTKRRFHFDADRMLELYLLIMAFIPLTILIASPIVLSILIPTVFVHPDLIQGGGPANWWLFIIVGFLLFLEPLFLFAAKMVIDWFRI